MRKLFIGCGVVVVLILGAIGYVSWRVWPAVKELRAKVVTLTTQLDELDAAFPFDDKAQQHLDGERFAASLQLRVDLMKSMQSAHEDLDRIWDKNDDSTGFFERINRTLSSFASVLPQYAAQLSNAKMGPTEFGWHTQLFWSTLKRVDAGVAPELKPLDGQYAKFKEDYDVLAREQKWKPLEALIGEFPPAVLGEAMTIMERNIGLVQQGLIDTQLDFYYMTPLNKLPDVQALRDGAEEQPGAPTQQTPPPAVTVPVPATPPPAPAAPPDKPSDGHH